MYFRLLESEWFVVTGTGAKSRTLLSHFSSRGKLCHKLCHFLPQLAPKGLDGLLEEWWGGGERRGRQEPEPLRKVIATDGGSHDPRAGDLTELGESQMESLPM